MPKGSEARPEGPAGSALEIAPSVHQQMFQLEQLVENGNEAASRQMYNIAYWATFWLNSVARRRLDLFIPIAARKVSWPMMWGAHSDDVKDNKAFAENLMLGSRTGINFSQVGKTFSLKVPANQIAMYLVSLAQLAIQYRPRKGPLYRRGAASARRSAQRKSALKLEAWGRGEGRRLPLFSRATLSEWKPAVRKLFRLCYGETFDEHPRLQELKHSIVGHAKDAAGKQTPGVVREAMLRKVLQALHSIAPLD